MKPVLAEPTIRFMIAPGQVLTKAVVDDWTEGLWDKAVLVSLPIQQDCWTIFSLWMARCFSPIIQPKLPQSVQISAYTKNYGLGGGIWVPDEEQLSLGGVSDSYLENSVFVLEIVGYPGPFDLRIEYKAADSAMDVFQKVVRWPRRLEQADVNPVDANPVSDDSTGTG